MNCGGLTFEFFNVDADLSSLDSDIFLDDRSAGGHNLAVKYNEDVTKVGIYPVKYRVYHTLYSSNIVTLAEPFVVTIIDPCDKPDSLTASSATAQEYTITADPKTYQVPAFTPVPAWCAITYTYTVDDSSGGGAVAFEDDQNVRQFTFDYEDDLDFCGPVSTDYTVTVLGEIGITETKTDSTSFTLTLKNPCIDSSHVSFEKPGIISQLYELYEHDPPGF